MARRINGVLVSHDYEDLLIELKSDILEFQFTRVGIVRGEEREGYKPIIDYYIDGDDINEPVEWLPVKEVVEEMEEMDSVF